MADEADLDELFDLVFWLPSESAFRRFLDAEKNTEKAIRLSGWTQSEDLALLSVNLLQKLIYITEQTNSKNRIPVPQIIEGPRGREPRKSNRQNLSVIARQMMAEARRDT